MCQAQSHNPKASSVFGNVSKLIGGDAAAARDEIAFLKTKARDGKHWGLLSSTLLEEARVAVEIVRHITRIRDRTDMTSAATPHWRWNA